MIKKYLLALIIISTVFITAATPVDSGLEQTAKEIINHMNKQDYSEIWSSYLSEQTKQYIAEDLNALKINPAAITLMQGLGITAENIKNMPPEEYFIKTTKYYENFIKSQENADKVFHAIETKGNMGFMLWDQGERKSGYKMIKENNRWYILLEKN